MTRRERILALLRREPLDRVPWNGDLDWWIRYLRETGQWGERYAGEMGRLRLHRDLGVGFYLQGHFPFRTVYDGGVRVKTEKRGNDTAVTFETPLGTLREVQRYLPEGHSDAYTEHLLKDAEDLPVLRYVWEHTRYEPDYGLASRLTEAVGDLGVVLLYTPRTPFMELVTCLAGIENLVFAMDDDPEEFEALFEVMKTRFEEAAEITLNAPCDCVMIPENLSSEVVGPAYYRRYMAPLHRKWTARIREAGKYSFIHMDGTLAGLLEDVAGSGFDVLEALTPAPVGDLTWEEMDARVRGRSIVWGGIHGGYFTDVVSDEDFDEHVIRLLEFCKSHPGTFTAGVSDQVCPGSRPERIARVETLCEQYGWYEK